MPIIDAPSSGQKLIKFVVLGVAAVVALSVLSPIVII